MNEAVPPPSDPNVALIIGGFLIVFPLFWCGIVWLISRMGWARMAQRFSAIRPIEGRRFQGCGARLGIGTNYSGCLNVIVGHSGLYLVPMILFRPGHQPLMIPWDNLKDVQEHKILWHQSLVLKLEVNGVSLAVMLPAAARELLKDLKGRAPASVV